MEEQTMLNEILKALELHSKKMDKRFDQVEERLDRVETRLDQVEERLDRVETRLDRIEKKFDGTRVEITETQETVDFLSSKTIQHEKKLRELKSALG